eukprot:NODE_9_length_47730_cov_0.323718.p13 type:complete len:309 gc:universal NODE_9_length_47730_cov_0.323718:30127-29201(-)
MSENGFILPLNKHQYQIENKVGEGTFASVYACRHTSGALYACKKFHLSMLKLQKLDRYVYNEIAIMNQLNHPNVIHLIDYYYEEHFLYVIMDLLNGGELMDKLIKLKHFDEGHAQIIIKQLLRALSYLHGKHIVHRDIKPENVVFVHKDKLDLVLVDFGLAAHIDPLDRPSLLSPAGSKGFVAPEILLGEPYNQSVDMWSIGVTAYFILCGYTPFENLEKDEGLDEHLRIMSGNYRFNKGDWNSISAEAKDFIKHLLIVDPLKRLSADEALSHPWLNNVMTLGRKPAEIGVLYYSLSATTYYLIYTPI